MEWKFKMNLKEDDHSFVTLGFIGQLQGTTVEGDQWIADLIKEIPLTSTEYKFIYDLKRRRP